MTVATDSPELTLDQKVDLLTEQVAYLVAETRRQAELLDMVGEFVEDAAPLATDAMDRAVVMMAEAEASGYLDALREIARPELLEVLAGMVEAMRQEQRAVASESEEAPSLWALLKQLRDPDVRRGMGRALHTLRTVSVETTVH